MVPATGRATARRAAVATVRSSTATRAPGGMDRKVGWSCSRLRQTLVNISATIAPELPWADKMAAWTRASNWGGESRSAPVTSGTAWAMPASVSSMLEPVSASETGNTFMALSASADSAMTTVARRSQALQTCHKVGAC